jgi:hypothetical protein
MKQFITWLFFPLILIFKKRQPKIIEKIEERTQAYEELIKEYELIQKKESTLSSKKRQYIIEQVNFLVLKGHLKAN